MAEISQKTQTPKNTHTHPLSSKSGKKLTPNLIKYARNQRRQLLSGYWLGLRVQLDHWNGRPHAASSLQSSWTIMRRDNVDSSVFFQLHHRELGDRSYGRCKCDSQQSNRDNNVA